MAGRAARAVRVDPPRAVAARRISSGSPARPRSASPRRATSGGCATRSPSSPSSSRSSIRSGPARSAAGAARSRRRARTPRCPRSPRASPPRSSTSRRRCSISRTAARSAPATTPRSTSAGASPTAARTRSSRSRSASRRAAASRSLKVRYNRVFGYYIEITKTHLAEGAGALHPQADGRDRRALRHARARRARAQGAHRRGDARRARGGAVPRRGRGGRRGRTRGLRRRRARSRCSTRAARSPRSPRGAATAGPTVDDGAGARDRRRSPSGDRGDARRPGSFVPERLPARSGRRAARADHRPEHGRQVDLHAPGRADRAARADRQRSCPRRPRRSASATACSRASAPPTTCRAATRRSWSRCARPRRSSRRRRAARWSILDEVGRGTSTFDGVSIAWAVAEHLHDAIGARTLFATHYHELVALADSRPRVRNVSVAVREHKGEIVFLRRVVPGGASRSYGIDVARLAGLPKSVIDARPSHHGAARGRRPHLGATPQLSLLPTAPPSPALARLAAIDPNRIDAARGAPAARRAQDPRLNARTIADTDPRRAGGREPQALRDRGRQPRRSPGQERTLSAR